MTKKRIMRTTPNAKLFEALSKHPRKTKKRDYREQRLQEAVSQFIQLQYPDVIFTSEASGEHKDIVAATRQQKVRSGKKLPDLWIAEPRGQYSGLMIELKADWPFKANGRPKNKHVAQQIEVLKKLSDKGYLAEMIVGLDDAITIIKHYMNKPPRFSYVGA